MSTDVSELGVRIPKATKQEQIFSIITEDEDFRFGKIKVEKDKQRYTLPAPTTEDQDNTESAKAFYGVVLHFRPAFFKQDNGEMAEKRELTVIRCGKFMPEQLYVSKSGLWNWKGFLKSCKDKGVHYMHVLVKFTADPGQSADGKYKFSKVKCEIVRDLEEAEMDYIHELAEVAAARVAKYSSSGAELDEAEDSFMDAAYKNKKPAESDEDEDTAAKAAKQTRAVAEEEDEEPAPKPKKKAVVEEEDDEEPAPKPKKKAAPKDEEPVTKGKGKYPDIDDEDDEDLKPKPKKKAAVEEDDEE